MPLDRFGDDAKPSSVDKERDSSKRTVASLQAKCTRLEHRLQVMEVELHNAKAKAAKIAADAAADAAAAPPPRTPSAVDRRSSRAADGMAAALREQATVRALAAELALLEASAARPRAALEAARAQLETERRARHAAEADTARCREQLEALRAQETEVQQRRKGEAEEALVASRRQQQAESRALRQRLDAERAARERAEALAEQLQEQLGAGGDGRRGQAEVELLSVELGHTEVGLVQAQMAALQLGTKADQHAALAQRLLEMQKESAEQAREQAGLQAHQELPRASRAHSLSRLPTHGALTDPAARGGGGREVRGGGTAPMSKLRSSRGLPP